MTINEGIALQKIMRERLTELRNLRNSVATDRYDIWTIGESKEKTTRVEPKYDVKAVDRKVTELELAIYKLDAAIKQANAVAEIKTTVDVDKLLEPLQ